MNLIIILFSIYGFLESSAYAIYQYQKNKAEAISIIILSSFGLVLPIFSLFI